MTVVYPGARNYQGALTAQPADKIYKKPPEGGKAVNLAIKWTDYASANYTVAVNLQAQQQLQFSQICGVYIDNGNCSTFVTVFFTDTQFGINIQPFSRKLFPAITNGLQFYVVVPAGGGTPTATDTTLINVLNEFVPPSLQDPLEVTTNPTTSLNVNVTNVVFTLDQPQTYTQGPNLLLSTAIGTVDYIVINSAVNIYLSAIEITANRIWAAGPGPSAIGFKLLVDGVVMVRHVVVMEAGDYITTGILAHWEKLALFGKVFTAEISTNNAGLNTAGANTCDYSLYTHA